MYRVGVLMGFIVFFVVHFLQFIKIHWPQPYFNWYASYPIVYKQYTIRNRVLEADIRTIVNKDGVFVLWGLTGSGKTTTLLQVASDLQKNGTMIIYTKPAPGADFQWFTDAIFLPTTRALVKLRRRVFIIIDQFDDVIADEDTRAFVVSLAVQSFASKKFCVLITVSNSSMAQTLLSWHGGKKIKLLSDPRKYKWSEEQMRALVNESAGKIHEVEKEQIIQLGIRSGNVREILAYIRNSRTNETLLQDEDVWNSESKKLTKFTLAISGKLIIEHNNNGSSARLFS
jgi:hypothetical protein